MIPDLGESLPIILLALVAFAVRERGRFWGKPIARAVFTCRNMAKRTGAVSDNETQVWVSLKRRLDLEREIVHHIQKRGIGLGLIGDERSTEFEEDEFFHTSI